MRFLILAPLFLSVTAVSATAEVDFVHQVVPILKEHCTECHGGEKAKGGFSQNTREMFLEDEAAAPGSAAESYFLELIEDSDPEFQMPPEKKDRVPAAQVAILKTWIDEGMKWEPGFTFGVKNYEPPLKPRRPELPGMTDGRENPIDRLIDQYLTENKLSRPEPVDDATFFRRAHLDLIGLLPEPENVEKFLADNSPGKRNALVGDLLAQDIPYADHWLTFWNDLLRNDYAGTGFITGGRKQISTWLYDSLKTNKPFDTMVRELIAPPDGESAGFIDGIKWRGEVSAGQTLPIQFSQSISQSFLGINMKCASCHDSFIDQWKLTDAYGLAAIYAEEPLEIHRCDKPVGETAKAAWLFPEIGNIKADAPKSQRLAQLALLMIHPENGRVPRTIVNRLWAQLMGRGIVHPLDAMQTEPWSADLLDWLAADFQDNGYDLKRTLFLIATSQAYQSRSEPLEKEVSDGDYTYAGPRAKRLTAEQFVDAVWQITGTSPVSYHAPVVRGTVSAELIEKLTFPSSWVWSAAAAEGPLPGDAKILLRREFTPAKPVRSAGIIATADNTFSLYFNNQPILSGEKWTELGSAPATNLIRPGKNTILMVAGNKGQKPNAAGAFCAIRIEYQDGSDEVIATDSAWEVSESVPAGNSPGRWKLDELPWESAHPIPGNAWKDATDARIGEKLAAASVGSSHSVRAGLLKSDFLMRALGRPNRDQIVTSRPNDLTTLEALELANNAELSGYLHTGAKAVAEKTWPSGDALAEQLYLKTLSRKPTADEQEALREILGDQPDPARIADVYWALTMTPEFLLIR